MELWIHWLRCAVQLRAACSRTRTFLWMVVVLVGFSIRSELLGVTSFVRASFLNPEYYHSLLRLFHSTGLDLGVLTSLWIRLVLRLFSPHRWGEYLILVADGLKVPKEGRKMPAVKSLHQESEDNSKPAFIMGHSFQAIGMLINSPLGKLFCVPLASRIHEGLVWSNADKRSLLDKLVALFLEIVDHVRQRTILLADAYYASRKIIKPLLERGHELVTRVRNTTTAYYPAARAQRRKRGRPQLYGKKVRLRQYWKRGSAFIPAPSPVYGEEGVTIEYLCKDLLWRPVGRVVRFVLVKHPARGRMILMTTLMSLSPLEVIELYGYRYKIEVSFKQAVHTNGTYAYHFWMKMMPPIRRPSGNQHLHKRSAMYREQVERKMGAYHRYVQLGCISQGILQYLAVEFTDKVWTYFCNWLRTMRCDRAPSEMVVAYALRNTFPEFLLSSRVDPDLEKFLAEVGDPDRMPGLTLGGQRLSA